MSDYPTNTSTFNPTILFNLLVGAAGAAGRRNPGPILTSIRNDLRAEIDRALPVIYLYDAEVIVDSMLEVLRPTALEASKALSDSEKQDSLLGVSKYITSIGTDLDNFVLPELHVKGKGKNKEHYVLPGDPGVYDAYINAYNSLVQKRPALIRAVKMAISKTVAPTISVDTLVNSIADIHARLEAAVVKITELGLPISSSQNAKFTRVIRAAGRSLRNISNKVRKVEDPHILIDGYNSASMVLIYAQNFNAAKTEINASITKALKSIFESSFKIQVTTSVTGFQAGNFAAAGHSGFISDTLTNINTPQLQAAKIIMAAASKDTPGLTNKFIEESGHAQWLIKINKGYGEGVNKLMELGISLVRSQPFNINSGVLSPSENSIINAELNSILDLSYRDALNQLKQKAATNTAFHNYLIAQYRSSPTLLENLTDTIEAALLGKKIPKGKTSKSGNTTDRKRVTSKSLPLSGSGGKKLKTSSISNKGKVPSPKFSNKTISLVKLQTLINSALAETIRRNMGEGTRRDVLNYRSGRFAESVKVERLSESRAGMITAFYTFMKNPYATFSQGGRQEFPRSRDPKLLISKSIREIAQEQVSNRLRAVLV